MLVGITGPIGSGKSFVSSRLEKLGYRVYNADARAKSLVEMQPELRQGVEDLLGKQAYDAAGRYDTAWVAEQVFRDPGLLVKLNALVHPVVVRHFLEWAHAFGQGGKAVFMESALLPRLSPFPPLDAVVLVKAPLDVRLERVEQRDGVGTSQVLARAARQASDEEFARIATYTIVNDGQREVDAQLQLILQSLGEQV